MMLTVEASFQLSSRIALRYRQRHVKSLSGLFWEALTDREASGSRGS